MGTKIFFLALLINCFFTVNSQTNDTLINEKDYFVKAHAMAANSFNDSLLKQYMKIYPDGEYVEKAGKTIDVCAWQNAHFKNSIESYEQYLKQFPEGKAASLAKAKLLALKDSTSSKQE